MKKTIPASQLSVMASSVDLGRNHKSISECVMFLTDPCTDFVGESGYPARSADCEQQQRGIAKMSTDLLFSVADGVRSFKGKAEVIDTLVEKAGALGALIAPWK